MFFDQEKEPQKTPYEEHIQTFAQRQGHGRRGRVHRRFPAARRSGPGGARQVQEGRVALLALRAQMPEIRRRGRRKALAAPGGRARGSGSACGMPCAWRGGVAGSVGGAGHPVHALECTWLMTVANRKTVSVFCQVVIGQCGVSFPSEKAVGFSPVRNWPVIARVLLFHCIRA